MKREEEGLRKAEEKKAKLQMAKENLKTMFKMDKYVRKAYEELKDEGFEPPKVKPTLAE
eukprot:CAMPEP_0177658460 /NCGR_PEP_ID=MMETSP0447-20121125/16817_1 /TAXON_ID=0 /ORGANISM="Stygamoeba regulata, Strain BSH-02190019" /LENGTH=58 /DNA_ID=CAMNT_0019163057 /DNA_START=177 /DNA_END=353 /DNA_ORIENTATION=-